MPTRADIVERAAKEVGYLSGRGFDQKNKFSDYLGMPPEAWCADCVTAIYGMAGLPLPSMQPGHRTGFSYVPAGWAYARQCGATTNSWQAQPGDIVCFDWTGSGTCQSSETHTGIVERWADGTLHTIEGNSGPAGGVNRHSWSAPAGQGNAQIAGVINAAKLVNFSDADYPAFPGRILVLKTPLMSGEDVQAWQQQMHDRGWQKVPVDSRYDVPTRDVCLAFQEQKQLVVDGQVGPQTWAAAFTEPIYDPTKPSGVANAAVRFNMGTNQWAVTGTPGRVTLGLDERWASAELQIDTSDGAWRVLPLPWNAIPTFASADGDAGTQRAATGIANAALSLNIGNGQWTVHGTPGAVHFGSPSKCASVLVQFNVRNGAWRLFPLPWNSLPLGARVPAQEPVRHG